MKSYEVIQKAVEEPGVKAVAAALKVSQALVYKWCEPPADSEDPEQSGAKNPLDRVREMYALTKGKMLIIGSYAGAPKAPAWVHNLRAHPRARIEVGTDAYDVDVRELPADERDGMYPEIVERAPVFAEYQAKTTRVIPLFELTPLGE